MAARAPGPYAAPFLALRSAGQGRRPEALTPLFSR